MAMSLERTDGREAPARYWREAAARYAGKEIGAGMDSARMDTQAQEATGSGRIADAERKYRRILDSVRDALVLFDMDGGFLEANAAFIEMLQYSPDELKRLTNPSLTPQVWHEAETLIIEQQVLVDGESCVYEKEYMRKDGSVVPVEMQAHLLRDEEGKPEAIWADVRDISERKRAEVTLREQEEFFRLVADNSGDFIAVLDLNGKRVYNSPSYRQFFGDTRYLEGTDSFVEIHPDDRDRVRKVFYETVKSGIGQRIEFRFVLPDGAVRQMESRSGVIRDDDGAVFRVVVVSNDITRRKQAEEQIYSLAFYDFLTKLPNRRMLSDRLRLAMAATRRSDRYGALMFLDLDNFKPINDTHGHGVGDLLLQEAARRIVQCVRGVDTVARFGGDEFVVVLNELDQFKDQSTAQAYMVAEKIRARLTEPYAILVRREEGHEVHVDLQCGSSIGLVLFKGFQENEEDLFRYADIAMYQAKDEGRNRICPYDPRVSVSLKPSPRHMT